MEIILLVSRCLAKGGLPATISRRDWVHSINHLFLKLKYGNCFQSQTNQVVLKNAVSDETCVAFFHSYRWNDQIKNSTDETKSGLRTGNVFSLYQLMRKTLESFKSNENILINEEWQQKEVEIESSLKNVDYCEFQKPQQTVVH